MIPRPISFVKKVPLCRACKYFESGKCKIFAGQNPVSGELAYVETTHARTVNNLCGPSGKYFKEK